MSHLEIKDPLLDEFVPLSGANRFGYYAVDRGVLIFAIDWNDTDVGQCVLRSCISEGSTLHLRHRNVEYRGVVAVCAENGEHGGMISAVNVRVLTTSLARYVLS